MTTYNGGKKRLSSMIYKAIADFEEQHDVHFTTYFEPFLGMGSVVNTILNIIQFCNL